MSTGFELAIKSTLDYMAMTAHAAMVIANPTLGYSELDDLIESDKVFGNKQPAIFWQLRGMAGDATNVRYEVEFLLGVKTVADRASYLLMNLLSALSDTVETGSTISIFDYSGTSAPYPKVGIMYVTKKDMHPQQFDGQAGLRFFTVTAKAVTWQQ